MPLPLLHTQASVAEQVATITEAPGSSAAAAEAFASNAVHNKVLQGLQGQWRLACWQLQNAADHAAKTWSSAGALAGKMTATWITVPLTSWWSWLTSQF
jgi:hypothetical protein